MKKRWISLALAMTLAASMQVGMSLCYAQAPNTMEAEAAEETDAKKDPETKEADAKAEETAVELEDGIYTVDFETDSSMFHINEAYEGKGTLTVEKGEMMLHITLVSKSIVNLFPGLAEDAQKEGAELLQPTEDEVTYSDGYTETVFGFDVPVTVIGEEFDLALIGKKGKWYDHKVKIMNPELKEEP